MPYRIQYISAHGAKHLRAYKYSGMDLSLVYKYILRPFYMRFVKIFPRNVAPNTITLSGFVFMWISFFLMRYWQPNFVNPDTPWWVFILCGVNVLLYQTFDAVDGAQARRTGMSGPLGELFDHGCDALNCTLLGMVAANVLQLGTSWQTVGLITCLSIAFFAATWDEYHTDTLYLGYINGVDEGLLVTSFTFILTGCVGQWIWIAEIIPGSNFRVNDLCVIIICFGSIVSALGDLVRVVKAVRAIPIEEEMQSQEACYLQWTPMVMMYSFFILWTVVFSEGLLFRYMWVLMSCLCFSFGNITSHLILAHLCREPYRMWNITLIPPLLGCVNAALIKYVGIQMWEENAFILMFFLVSVFSFVHFVVGVIDEVCEILDITAFTVPEHKWRAALEREQQALEAEKAAKAEKEGKSSPYQELQEVQQL